MNVCLMSSLSYCSSNITLYLVKSVNLYSAYLVVFLTVTIVRWDFVHIAR